MFRTLLPRIVRPRLRSLLRPCPWTSLPGHCRLNSREKPSPPSRMRGRSDQRLLPRTERNSSPFPGISRRWICRLSSAFQSTISASGWPLEFSCWVWSSPAGSCCTIGSVTARAALLIRIPRSRLQRARILPQPRRARGPRKLHRRRNPAHGRKSIGGLWRSRTTVRIRHRRKRLHLRTSIPVLRPRCFRRQVMRHGLSRLVVCSSATRHMRWHARHAAWDCHAIRMLRTITRGDFGKRFQRCYWLMRRLAKWASEPVPIHNATAPVVSPSLRSLTTSVGCVAPLT